MPHLIYLLNGYEAREDARRLETLCGLLAPGYTTELRKPAGGPAILEQPADFEQAKRAKLDAVRAIAQGECGAIIAAGAVAPGLRELRDAAAVPVIGPGEAALYLASVLGSRLVILTVAPPRRRPMRWSRRWRRSLPWLRSGRCGRRCVGSSPIPMEAGG